uniref:Matrix-remodeling-associated protein 7 isoform X2 n=1 Tax=Geotrypetes seraphini TaxID=260995 RepID=A0A6P8SFA9_GEOSA|nr:matrix-remodeling-associated protein 7 isoform X2 [Geotrypetes seraphini]
MDEMLDFYLLAALVTTVAAVVLASLVLKLRAGGDKDRAGETREAAVAREDRPDRGEAEDEEPTKVPLETEAKEETETRGAEGDAKEKTAMIPEEMGSAEEREAARTLPEEKQSPPRRGTSSSVTAEEEEEEEVDDEGSKEETQESEVAKAMNTDLADDGEEEQFSFKYSPGKLRGSHYEKMMTKEEREEEQSTSFLSSMSAPQEPASG